MPQKITWNIHDHAERRGSAGTLNREYLSILEKGQEMVFLTDKEGNILHSSPAVQQLFHYSNEEYKQLHIFDIIHPDDVPAAAVQLEDILEKPGSAVPFHLRNRSKQGEYHWVEGTVTNMLNDYGVSALVARFRDTTARKHAELEHQLQVQELNQRLQELNQFVYIISHNLRSPLANLTGLMNIMDTDLLDDYNKGIFELFQSATDRLNETIHELTHILNMKENKGVRITRINVEKLLEKISLTFSAQLDQPDIKLRRDFLCKHVNFNKSYLESILTNLLSNAIKYRDPERILEITIRLQKLENHSCLLTFADNGLGMDMKTNKELFGLHQRFHDHIKGNGVGLYITKSQITSLGGSITVDSQVGRGTVFNITFPD